MTLTNDLKVLREFRDYYAKAGAGLMAAIYQVEINKLEKK